MAHEESINVPENNKKENLKTKPKSSKSPNLKKNDIQDEENYGKSNSLNHKVSKEETIPKNKIPKNHKNNFLKEKEPLELNSKEKAESKIPLKIVKTPYAKSKSPFGKTETNNETKLKAHKKNQSQNQSGFKKNIKKFKFIEKQQPLEQTEKEDSKENEFKKYNTCNYRTKRSKSSFVLDYIEEKIDLELSVIKKSGKQKNITTSNEDNNFVTAMQHKGTLEINSLNMDDEYIQRQKNDVEISEIIQASCGNGQQEILEEIKEEKDDIFQKEMTKFLENTFQRPETPPFSLSKKISFHSKFKPLIQHHSKEEILFDPILQQYYDKNNKEYFELI